MKCNGRIALLANVVRRYVVRKQVVVVVARVTEERDVFVFTTHLAPDKYAELNGRRSVAGGT
jgi:hypothetical protein